MSGNGSPSFPFCTCYGHIIPLPPAPSNPKNHILYTFSPSHQIQFTIHNVQYKIENCLLFFKHSGIIPPEAQKLPEQGYLKTKEGNTSRQIMVDQNPRQFRIPAVCTRHTSVGKVFFGRQELAP